MSAPVSSTKRTARRLVLLGVGCVLGLGALAACYSEGDGDAAVDPLYTQSQSGPVGVPDQNQAAPGVKQAAPVEDQPDPPPMDSGTIRQDASNGGGDTGTGTPPADAGGQ